MCLAWHSAFSLRIRVHVLRAEVSSMIIWSFHSYTRNTRLSFHIFLNKWLSYFAFFTDPLSFQHTLTNTCNTCRYMDTHNDGQTQRQAGRKTIRQTKHRGAYSLVTEVVLLPCELSFWFPNKTSKDWDAKNTWCVMGIN